DALKASDPVLHLPPHSAGTCGIARCDLLMISYLAEVVEVTVRGDFPAPTTAPRPGRPALRWLKRGVIAVLLVVAALAVAGTVYQAVCERADARNHPPPGELVGVGSHRL